MQSERKTKRETVLASIALLFQVGCLEEINVGGVSVYLLQPMLNGKGLLPIASDN